MTLKKKRKKLKRNSESKSKEGIVVFFNENLGIGLIKLKDGEKLKVSYRMIEGEGLKMLFEGEKVIVDENGMVKRIENYE